MNSTERWRKWKATDPNAREKLRLKHKAWRAKNPEKCREKRRKWGQRNAQHVAEYLKEWHERKPWKKGEYALRWLWKNPNAGLHTVMLSLDADVHPAGGTTARSLHMKIPDENSLTPFEALCQKEEGLL